MPTLNTIAVHLNRVLAGFDIAIVRRSRLDALQSLSRQTGSSRPPPPLPDKAEEYLSFRNPRLVALNSEYQQALPEVMQPTRWTKEYISRHVDLRSFRGDNAYVFSDKNVELTFVLTSYYVETVDSLHLLETLGEDGLFGAPLFEYKPGMYVSRDLLDSIVEIYSLLAHLPENALRAGAVLDVGAGYGRFAYRLTRALDYVKRVYCTDAVPISTFLCEYYLGYRNVDRAAAVPLPEVAALLQAEDVSLAINIHSFSECSMAAIDWWIRLLQRSHVRYLFIVPNPADHGGTQLLTQELDGTHKDYAPLLTSYGYNRTKLVPKYNDDVIQRLGVTPTCHHFYELS